MPAVTFSQLLAKYERLGQREKRRVHELTASRVRVQRVGTEQCPFWLFCESQRIQLPREKTCPICPVPHYFQDRYRPSAATHISEQRHSRSYHAEVPEVRQQNRDLKGKAIMAEHQEEIIPRPPLRPSGKDLVISAEELTVTRTVKNMLGKHDESFKSVGGIS